MGDLTRGLGRAKRAGEIVRQFSQIPAGGAELSDNMALLATPAKSNKNRTNYKQTVYKVYKYLRKKRLRYCRKCAKVKTSRGDRYQTEVPNGLKSTLIIKYESRKKM